MVKHEEDLLRCCLGYSYRVYWKKNKKEYDCYCTVCGKRYTVSSERLSEMKEAGVCSQCHNKVQVYNYRKPVHFSRYIGCDSTDFGDVDGVEAYLVDVEFDWEGVTGSAELVYKRKGETASCIHIFKNFYQICYSSYRDKWRKLSKQSYQNYEKLFYWVYSADEVGITHKQYLTDIAKDIPLKSNQIEFVKKHLPTAEQLKYIYMFDLKSWDELMKYNDFIRKQYMHRHVDKPLNITYLDYIVRENIQTVVFMDYVDQCRLLHIKPEKPKNFEEKHAELAKVIAEKKEKLVNEGVANRYEEVKKQYDGAPFTVFANADEIRTVAQELHNCMASNYLRKYAEGTTDIFYGKSDQGEILYGIEIHDHRLMQLYGAYNKPVSEDIQHQIVNWCKSNNIKCNLYGGQTI